MNFNNKIIIVTGAASGIGFGIAEAYVEKGAKVVVADVELDSGNRAIEAFKTM
jgi:NAD(P)-dependent dehydrogenase (short-subunit alcohol dehydrogenase family)